MEIAFNLSLITLLLAMSVMLIVLLNLLVHISVLMPLYNSIQHQTKQIISTIDVAIKIIESTVLENNSLFMLSQKLVSDLKIFQHSVQKHLPVPFHPLPTAYKTTPLIVEIFTQLSDDVTAYNDATKRYNDYCKTEKETLFWGKYFIKMFPRIATIPVVIHK